MLCFVCINIIYLSLLLECLLKFMYYCSMLGIKIPLDTSHTKEEEKKKKRKKKKEEHERRRGSVKGLSEWGRKFMHAMICSSNMNRSVLDISSA